MIRYILIILLTIAIGCQKSGDNIVEVIPLAPTELKAFLITNDQIKLEWKDNSTNETGYKIERKTDITNFKEIGSITNDITTYTDNSVLINTNYTYRVYSYNKVGKSLNYSNEASIKTLNIPIITTTKASSITIDGAKSGGSISSDGGAAISSRGIVWSTSPSPTIALTTKTIDGTGTGPFSSNITGLIPNTKYYVKAYATNSVGTSYGAEEEFTTLQISLPTVTTNSVSNIKTSSALCGGNVSFNGNLPIAARGVVWSTSPSPTIALTTKTIDGTVTGTFQSSIKGLTDNTKYYVRAYATNSVGTSYGSEFNFTTRTAANLASVKIGTQIWTTKNLDVSTFRNGDPIPEVKDGTEWAINYPKWCYFNNDPALGAIYGKLYNWQAVNDPRGLAPEGWHVPTIDEWAILSDYLGYYSGAKLKEAGILHWASPNLNATNESGFSALGGGCRGGSIPSPFALFNTHGLWWTANEEPSYRAQYRSLIFSTSLLHGGAAGWGDGFSVRLIKD
jgi:uncharacterized protein (TIGR02145 family)